MPGIKFGTDGWRDIIADKFTFENVRTAVQGIAYYLNSQQLARRGVVIGFDHRFLSEKFAEAAANILVGNGIKVYMPDRAIPTPVAAFAVRFLKAAGAVMITASHNPPEYNGLKFIPDYAGPALPDVTDQLEKEIQRAEETGKIYELSLNEGIKLELVQKLEIEDEYVKHLLKLVMAEPFQDYRVEVVADPMFGAGCGYLDRILTQLGCSVTAINNYRDPLFGGSMPEPTGEMLNDLKRIVVEQGAGLGLALDGDADRFGVVDERGMFVSPNKILYLLCQHLIKTRTFRGPVARTLATTHMLDRIAERNGLRVVETSVGFKYIGQCLREQGCIMGGEESGGLSILGHVPEKDGILACLLVAEMMAHNRKSLTEIHNEFIEEFGSVESERLDIRCEPKDKENILARMKAYRPKQVAGLKVDRVSELEGKKVILEDSSWLLIRPSGTEPVVRLYVEAFQPGLLGKIQEEVKAALGLNA